MSCFLYFVCFLIDNLKINISILFIILEDIWIDVYLYLDILTGETARRRDKYVDR